MKTNKKYSLSVVLNDADRRKVIISKIGADVIAQKFGVKTGYIYMLIGKRKVVKKGKGKEILDYIDGHEIAIGET
ncbi:MAG: hypothetical protein KAW12_07030 [Candidatus Aminicenantes bacterium]|nr:hypothetical protein [Candidatus Aminicenantes bacterium]